MKPLCTKLVNLIFLFIVINSSAIANEVSIQKVELDKSSNDYWQIQVTIKHADSGWKHYANAWRVVNENGVVLKTRTLFHPHVNEQPFTRALRLQIPKNSTIISIEAHDTVHGWSHDKVVIDLRKNKGDRYIIKH